MTGSQFGIFVKQYFRSHHTWFAASLGAPSSLDDQKQLSEVLFLFSSSVIWISLLWIISRYILSAYLKNWRKIHLEIKSPASHLRTKSKIFPDLLLSAWNRLTFTSAFAKLLIGFPLFKEYLLNLNWINQ